VFTGADTEHVNTIAHLYQDPDGFALEPDTLVIEAVATVPIELDTNPFFMSNQVLEFPSGLSTM
jgi:hypothetical protein